MKTKKILSIVAAISILAAMASCARIKNAFSKESDTGDTAISQNTEPVSVDNDDFDAAVPGANPTEVAVTRKIYDPLKKDSSGSYSVLLAEFSTTFNKSLEGRTTNLYLAADAIDGIVLQSGQTFSFNQVVSKRTSSRGFQTAKVVMNGEFDDGLGGGVCQASSTLFNTALRANMTIVERSCHSLKVTYVPTAFDAAVQWTSKDFQFRNDFDVPIQIKMQCTGNKITSQIFASENIDIGTVTFTSSGSGKNYTMSRFVNGVKNYTTSSTYKE